MRPDRWLQALGTVALGLLGTLGPDIAWGQSAHEVRMTNQLIFDPSGITIVAGDTVRWVNVSTALPHTATADQRNVRLAGFNSGSRPSTWLQPGESFEFTFTTPGEFPYHCVPHQAFGMVGTVIVNASTTAFAEFFIASAEEGRVILQGMMEGRNDRLGFNVLRSTGWAQEFRQINDAMIPLQSNPSQATAYTFIDADIVPGTSYYYVLEDVNRQGMASFRGPAVITTR